MKPERDGYYWVKRVSDDEWEIAEYVDEAGWGFLWDADGCGEPGVQVVGPEIVTPSVKGNVDARSI